MRIIPKEIVLFPTCRNKKNYYDTVRDRSKLTDKKIEEKKGKIVKNGNFKITIPFYSGPDRLTYMNCFCGYAPYYPVVMTLDTGEELELLVGLENILSIITGAGQISGVDVAGTFCIALSDGSDIRNEKFLLVPEDGTELEGKFLGSVTEYTTTRIPGHIYLKSSTLTGIEVFLGDADKDALCLFKNNITFDPLSYSARGGNVRAISTKKLGVSIDTNNTWGLESRKMLENLIMSLKGATILEMLSAVFSLPFEPCITLSMAEKYSRAADIGKFFTECPGKTTYDCLCEAAKNQINPEKFSNYLGFFCHKEKYWRSIFDAVLKPRIIKDIAADLPICREGLTGEYLVDSSSSYIPTIEILKSGRFSGMTREEMIDLIQKALNAENE